MQPRLVAITSPGSACESEDYIRSRSRWQSSLQSRITDQLFKISWKGWKTRLAFPQRKRITKPRGISSDNWEERFELPANHSRESLDGPPFDYTNQSRWQKIPEAVFENILRQLELLDSELSNEERHRSRINNLLAIQLTCKSWALVAKKQLYEKIRVDTTYTLLWDSDPPEFYQPRVHQLKRTLRSDPNLSSLVKHLDFAGDGQQPVTDEILDRNLVASIIVVCPRLEYVTGLEFSYRHRSDPFFHALSTRTKLTKHTWIIGEDEIVQSRASKRITSGILSSDQTRQFLQYHSYWRNLESLKLVSHNGKGVMERSLFTSILHMLPALKHLHLSSFDANDFSTRTLLSLPPLESLVLDGCHGISESGICMWAESLNAIDIRSLVLENQKITSLLTVSAIFSFLTKLQFFRIVQLEFEPTLPLEFEIVQPLLTSASLKSLDWCITMGQPDDVLNSTDFRLSKRLQSFPQSKSTQYLISSILHFGFPELKKATVPSYGDLTGLLRWRRHTEAASRLRISQSHRASNLNRTSSVPTSPAQKRISKRFSHRPSSPNFMEYDQWKKPLTSPLREESNDALELSPDSDPKRSTTSMPTPSKAGAAVEITRSDSTSAQSTTSTVSESSASVTTISESASDPQNQPTSPVTSISSPSSSPRAASLARSSATTLRAGSHSDENENETSPLEKKVTFIVADDAEKTPVGEKYTVSPWARDGNGLTTSIDDTAGSRMSGISIMLDGFAWTAAN